MVMNGVLENPIRLSEIQIPKRWPLVPLRAAYCCVAQVVQLGLMRRRKLLLLQLSLFPPHQALIRWAATPIHERISIGF